MKIQSYFIQNICKRCPNENVIKKSLTIPIGTYIFNVVFKKKKKKKTFTIKFPEAEVTVDDRSRSNNVN